MSALKLSILSVNVAMPRLLGEQNGEPLLSAIAKKPVASATIEVGRINLAGDAQANLEKHGGPDKAVYAYPSANWAWWQEREFTCAPGAFGENLTLQDADETSVRIGDRFAWGDAVLEVAQPRVPCIKLQMHTGREEVGALMTMSARCGWYFRVLTTGKATTVAACLTRIEQGLGATVREAFVAAFDRKVSDAYRREVAAGPGLSEAWRKRLLTVGS